MIEHNLKTFPRVENYQGSGSVNIMLHNCIQWKKAFEKELQHLKQETVIPKELRETIVWVHGKMFINIDVVLGV